MYSSQAEPSGNFVFVFLKLDHGVNAHDDNEEDHDDDNEDDNDENEEPPGERVNAHLAVFLHTDLLQWVKVVRYLPDYNDNVIFVADQI